MAEDTSGTASSCAQCVATKGRDGPLGPPGTGTASGPAPQRPSSKGRWADGWWAGRRGGGGGAEPGHTHVIGPPPSNAAVTMPRDRIKGSTVQCPLPGLAWGQPEDIREEVLEKPAELLGGGCGSKTGGGWTRLLERRRTSESWRHLRLSGLFSRRSVAKAREHLLEEHCRARCPHPLQSQWQQP